MRFLVVITRELIGSHCPKGTGANGTGDMPESMTYIFALLLVMVVNSFGYTRSGDNPFS